MENLLDIFLITYNRKPYLEVTLNRIFSEGSPLKKYSITILDNNSNDGTDLLCNSFKQKYSNLKYIKNKKNIGLAGNICKAMEYAEKKYFWIICDNDEINFTSWPEIEKAMSDEFDLIMTSVDYNNDKVQDKRSFALTQSTFLPACIYKNAFLTDDVMVYALTDIHTILPHVCVACNIINNNGRIYVPQTSIITLTGNVKIENMKEYSYDRVSTTNKKKMVHERTMQYNFPAGIVSAFNSLEDKKLQKEVIRNFIYRSRINGYGPFLPLINLYRTQYFKKEYKMPPYIWKQFMDLIPLKDKIWALCNIYIAPLKFYYTGDTLAVMILGRLKTKLIKKARGNKFFDKLVYGNTNYCGKF